MGIVIDCTENPVITGPLWRPDACNAGPVLIYAMEVLAQYVCDLEIGDANNFAVIPADTPEGDWNDYFTGGVPQNDSLVVIDGQIWATNNAGVSWFMVSSPEFRYTDGSGFADPEAPTPAELRALFPADTPTGQAMVYNAATQVFHMTDDIGVSWNQNGERTFRVGQDIDFVDPSSPTAAELRALFANSMIEQAEVYIPSSTSRWYTVDFGGTWDVVSIFTKIQGTLAEIQALGAAGLFHPGTFYEVTDNTHAEGGNIMAEAFDTEHLTNQGWYYHGTRQVWFPIVWSLDTGNILEMTDPLYGNYAFGTISVDSFYWSVNDNLDGTWTNNRIINSLFTFGTVTHYDNMLNNSFDTCAINLDGILPTISQNVCSGSTITIENALLDNGSIQLNSIVNSDVTFTDIYGNVLSNKFYIASDITLSNIGPSTTVYFNEFHGQGTVVISNITTSDIRNNEFRELTLFSLDNFLDANFEGNHFILLSNMSIEELDSVDFVGNRFEGITTTFGISTLANGDIIQNTVTNDSTFTMTNLDPVEVENNQVHDGSTFSVTNAAAAASGNVFKNTIDGGSTVTVNRTASFVRNTVTSGSSLTVTTSVQATVEENHMSGSSTASITASAGSLQFKKNTLAGSSITTLTSVTGALLVNNNLFFAGTTSITAASGSVIGNTVIGGVSSVGITINSASFTGEVSENFIMDGTATFAAHTGVFKENTIINSAITGTKTGAFSTRDVFYRNMTLTVAAGATESGIFYGGGQHIFNNALADVDFQVKGDTDANSLYGDASTDSWGFGTDTPTAWAHFKAATTARATMRIPVGTAPSSPNEGDIWNDSTQKALQAFEDGIKQSLNGTIFTQTASVTVANNSAETTLVGSGVGTMTLPANFLTVGKTIQVIAGGFYGTDAVAPNMILRLKLGSTTILQQDAGGTLAAGIGNDRGWMFNGEFTIRAVGASGTAIGTGIAWFSIGGTAQKSYPFQMLAVSATFNTTGTLALALTADWDVADSDNTITCTHMSAVIKN